MKNNGIMEFGDYEWDNDMDLSRKIAEKRLSNDYYIIHNTSDIEFREYIINRLNDIQSYLYSNER